jgi:hypothetical protein
MPSPILWFKEIPSAPELSNILERFLNPPEGAPKLF